MESFAKIFNNFYESTCFAKRSVKQNEKKNNDPVFLLIEIDQGSLWKNEPNTG